MSHYHQWSTWSVHPRICLHPQHVNIGILATCVELKGHCDDHSHFLYLLISSAIRVCLIQWSYLVLGFLCLWGLWSRSWRPKHGSQVAVSTVLCLCMRMRELTLLLVMWLSRVHKHFGRCKGAPVRSGRCEGAPEHSGRCECAPEHSGRCEGAPEHSGRCEGAPEDSGRCEGAPEHSGRCECAPYTLGPLLRWC